jgi:hypothetical protein
MVWSVAMAVWLYSIMIKNVIKTRTLGKNKPEISGFARITF